MHTIEQSQNYWGTMCVCVCVRVCVCVSVCVGGDDYTICKICVLIHVYLGSTPGKYYHQGSSGWLWKVGWRGWEVCLDVKDQECVWECACVKLWRESAHCMYDDMPTQWWTMIIILSYSWYYLYNLCYLYLFLDRMLQALGSNNTSVSPGARLHWCSWGSYREVGNSLEWRHQNIHAGLYAIRFPTSEDPQKTLAYVGDGAHQVLRSSCYFSDATV